MRKLILLSLAIAAVPVVLKVSCKNSGGDGQQPPFACQDNAATKAAYRFLSSDRIDEQHLLQGHSEATSQRIYALQGEKILLLQDTTTFGYHRDNPDAVGFAGNHT